MKMASGDAGFLGRGKGLPLQRYFLCAVLLLLLSPFPGPARRVASQTDNHEDATVPEINRGTDAKPAEPSSKPNDSRRGPSGDVIPPPAIGDPGINKGAPPAQEYPMPVVPPRQVPNEGQQAPIK
ncbi:hypothetical protein [Rhodopila sp.]|jgi:hypothetical protein|uniref:hypothetical protein n=1 Tax=Rhodopila sp. TaxID=2480087 RepID=UPI002CC47755|nr:hypothetical protein [Rhodopila sp.]HVZ10279.1 hypothetical protein [Rhodopila sp.]